MRKVGVISDLHANAPAAQAALSLLEREGVEELVVLGDLLTYGCSPLAVLEMLQHAGARWPATFLIGNHDHLYFELQRGEQGYVERLPAWIRESAQWTIAALGALRLEDAFPWMEEHEVGGLLFSHANPFGSGDWTCLQGDDVCERAARTLRTRGFAAGAFGHTHRVRDEVHAGVRLLNPGSLGQPRDGRGRSTAAVWDGCDWRIVEVSYDVQAHCDEVRRSSLSASTRREILKYYSGNAPCDQER